MGKPQQESTLINGFFGRRVWRSDEDPDNELFGVGIHVENFIKSLRELPANNKGFVNLTIGTQKKDNNKLTMFYREYEGDRQQPSSSSSPSAAQAPKSKQQEELSDDDLPF